MSREQIHRAIILKKQPYKEADEIITIYTKERGKLRALAKSVKSSKSKLQQRLQVLFLANLILSSGSLPKIISVEPIAVFAGLRRNLSALKRAFYALELILKFTGDEHKNEPLFNLLLIFLKFLDAERREQILNLALAKFKLEILEASGLGIHQPKGFLEERNIFFSPGKGGFVAARQPDSLPVKQPIFEMFLNLKKTDFISLSNLDHNQNLENLQNILSNFIEYQLERQIKSEKYLRQENVL